MNNDKKIIIAIDGFSSSGKSTMAKELAKRIGYRYIDSGAMYRAVTLYALRHGMILDDGSVATDKLISALCDIHIDFLPCPDGQHTLLNGEDVEKEIRSLRVSSMDGRDIGTTVFPDAELKIYVNAPAETRARRRWLELQQKGDTTSTYEQVLENVMSRDHIDMTRKESPLRRADDAIDLDNSNMTIDEQNEWLINRFNSVVGR